FHLPHAYARAYIAQPVVIAYMAVLVMGSLVPRLGGKENSLCFIIFASGNKGAPARGGYNLVAVKGEDGDGPKGATLPVFITAAQRLGAIFHYGNIIFL